MRYLSIHLIRCVHSIPQRSREQHYAQVKEQKTRRGIEKDLVTPTINITKVSTQCPDQNQLSLASQHCIRAQSSLLIGIIQD